MDDIMDFKCIQQCLFQADTSYLKKNECLIKLSNLLHEQNQQQDSNVNSDTRSIVKILCDFSHYHDPRVRLTALCSLLSVHENGIHLDISLYSEFCELLSDEYESARITAMKLIQILSLKYKDCLSCQVDCESIRIMDDAFIKICSMMGDSSIKVRVEAARLLGKFTDVTVEYLHQTLDKKLMSNLKSKKSAHQRHRETFESGEWTSGRRWVSDAPSDQVCPETVNLMNIGACGAFIHGLEDEFYDVRMATLESMCSLAQIFPSFGFISIDFFVDMFNDEIQEIRLKAIQCLTKISRNNIILREDQIDITLSVLEDFSIDIREALHTMLSNCKLSSKAVLDTTIENLLKNLKRYPCDKESIWSCLQKLGQNNVYLTFSLVPELLLIHPFLKLPESALEDPEYVAILILIFNAAKDCPLMIDLLENHTKRHYFYLKDSYPHLVPTIDLLSNDTFKCDSNFSSCNYDNFFLKIFDRLHDIMLSEKCSNQMSILSNAIRDLQKIAVLYSNIAPSSNFFSIYLQCEISLRKIVSNSNWINTFLLSPSQSSVFRSSLQQLLSSTFTLLNCFHGLHPLLIICIQQTRVKALALQLIAIIHGSNVSALGLCDAFLSEMNELKRLSNEHNIQLSEIINIMLATIASLNQPRPGSVARALQPIFLTSPIGKICDLNNILNQNAIADFKNIKMTYATILEPREKSDVTLNFTAGLVLALPFHALIENIQDIQNIKIKVQYPDQQIHLIQPKLNEFREKPNQSNSSNVKDYRLMTKICITSSGVWSESSFIEISLLLDFRDISSSSLTTTQISSSFLTKSSGIRSTKSDDNLVIDICKPIRLMICPTKPRRLVI